MLGWRAEYVNMVDVKASDDYLAAIELFYFAYRAFTSRPDKVLESRGLGRVHHRILYFVGRQPGQTVSQLQATLKVSKQALNAPLRQLVEMRLIAVETAPNDRRAKQLSLTCDGLSLERQLTATQIRQLSAAFEAAGADAALGWRTVMQAVSGKPEEEV